MNEQAGIASQARALVPPMPRRARIELVRAWDGPPKRLSMKESFRAGALVILYLAAYLAAGFAGVTFMEWAWMRIFG